MVKPIDLSGKTFGLLTAIRIVGSTKNKTNLWRCKCECGSYTTRSTSSLRNNRSVHSCGCYHKKILKEIGHKVGTNHFGEKHYRWKGGKTKNGAGYVVINHSVGEKHKGPKTEYEHRRLMEKHLGRKLDRNEVVHHINGDKTDNRIENLMVMENREHSKYHSKL